MALISLEHVSKVYPNDFFGYRKITVERPLRLNFQASPVDWACSPNVLRR